MKRFETVRQRGITLIALVVTIIVLLILAGVGLNLALNQNGIISKSKEAVNAHKNAETIEKTEMNQVVDDWDRIVGTGNGLTASQIKQDAINYYGKQVTNYICDKNAYNWQLYYSDGKNIYITTTDYVLATDCPNGKGGTEVTIKADHEVAFDDVINDYPNGVDDISPKMQKLLSKYKDTEYWAGNTNENIKSVAYLLDTNIWTSFKATNADWAIGAPTIELFADSYRDTHPDKYIDTAPTQYGYICKWSTDENYDGWYEHNDLSGLTQGEFNYLYTRPDSGTNQAYSWFSSPSNERAQTILGMADGGWINGRIGYNISMIALRPVVCLKEGTKLKKITNGDEISFEIV